MSSPLGSPADEEPSAAALALVIERVEEGFRLAQQRLREEVFATASTDGRLALSVNGEGLAVRVAVEPSLLADGPSAVERAVMEAINDAAIRIQERTTEAFQLAAEEYLGVPAAGVDPLSPTLRSWQRE